MGKTDAELRVFFGGKSILITGGCGSVGSALVDNLLRLDVGVVRVYDNNEYGLFGMQQKYKGESRLRFLVGDVRDKTRLQYALDTIDIVYHAAALKHVPLCEYNPFEAIKTNVMGTQNVIEASIEEDVGNFMLISTDKAVNPVNTMGATKLLCEKLAVAANLYKGVREARFSCVRFGNVLNSRGSVFPIFAEQIRMGGPVTLTSEGMKRYFMSMSQAAGLILEATALQRGGEVFVLKMPVLCVRDLAEAMIGEIAPGCGLDPRKIAIEVVGERGGEKTDEDLLTEYEAQCTIDLGDLLAIIPMVEQNENYPNVKFAKKIERSLLSTSYATPVGKMELCKLIREVLKEDLS